MVYRSSPFRLGITAAARSPFLWTKQQSCAPPGTQESLWSFCASGRGCHILHVSGAGVINSTSCPLPPAPRLHGEQAPGAADLHRDGRRADPETPRLLPGAPHHGENRHHHQLREDRGQHQSPGDPAGAEEQHEGDVSAGAAGGGSGGGFRGAPRPGFGRGGSAQLVEAAVDGGSGL